MGLRGERYETLRTIASGGMATVYLGRALGAGGFERLVAIKVLHPHLADEAEFVVMFLDEARLAARIRHPNVVNTLDVQQDQDGIFLVMDYIEGPSLNDIAKKLRKENQKLPLDILLRIHIDALAGLHAAHELTDGNRELLNLIHRDVSPHNILVATDGITRITDFGVARAESRLLTTREGRGVKGKLSYMSPEQVRSEPIDRRTDIYAAGVVLWELLTGQRMVRGENQGAIVRQILAGAQCAPRDVNPDVPQAIDAVCMRALRPEPGDRYATAAEFAEAIEVATQSSGLAIATQRAVAAFVTRLKAHKSALDLPLPSELPPRSRRDPALGSSSSSSSLPLPPDATRPPSRRAHNAALPAGSPPSSTTQGAVASDSILPTPRRKTGVGLFVLAAGIALLGAGAAGWWFIARPRLHAAAQSPAAAVSGLPIQPPSGAPPVPAEPQPKPSPSASSSPADAGPVQNEPALTGVKPGRRGSPVPTKASPAAPTEPAATVYRPKEL